jgi:hypothetical protein
MALHTPTHHAGITGDHRLMRDFLLAIGLAIVLIAVVGVASSLRITPQSTTGMTAQQGALVQYRAAEREDWAAGVPTQASSLIQFRAAERVDGATSATSESSSLIQFRAAERAAR